MGLFNKLFTKSHEPYDLKGRWYKVTLKQTANDLVISKTDIPVIDPSAFPNIPFGMALDPNNQGSIAVFKGIIVDMKAFTLKGSFVAGDAEFSVDTLNNPIPVSNFEISNPTPGEVYDLYLYIVKSNSNPVV